MNKKKYLLSIVIAVISTMSIFAQDRPERLCKEVISLLRKAHKDDAVSIEVFKTEYQISNRNAEYRNRLFNRHYTNIIKHFDTEEGKNCLCRYMIVRLDTPLIYDPSKEKQE
jgi:hypothetical protein